MDNHQVITAPNKLHVNSNVNLKFFKLVHNCLALLLIAWMNNGIFGYFMAYFPNILRWGTFIVWFFFACLSNKKFFEKFLFQTWTLLVFYLYLLILSNFSSADYIAIYLRNLLYLIIVYSIFLFYFNNTKFPKFNKVLSVFLFLDSLILSINTYIRLQSDPMISRYLATGNPTQYLGSVSLAGIGSYGFFYSLVSVIILLGFLFLNFQKRKLLNFFLIIIFMTVLIKASFTTAILFSFIFLITLIILRFTNKYSRLILIVFGILSLILSEGILSSIFNKLSHSNGISIDVAMRFNDLSEFFSGNGISGGDLSLRLFSYSQSINAFFNNVLTGVTVSDSLNFEAGGHSAWLDLLAQFGLFSIFLFLFLFKAYKYCINRVPENSKSLVNIYWLYFACLGVVNTLLFSNIFTIWLLLMPIAINSFMRKDQTLSTEKEVC